MIIQGRPISRQQQHRFLPAKKLLMILIVSMMMLVLCSVPTAEGASPKKAASFQSSNSKNKTKAAVVSDASSGLLIEDNPDYLEQVPNDASDDDGDDSDSDASDEESEEDGNKPPKSAIAKKAKKKKSGPVTTLKKHKAGIVMALALFAFRRELFALLLHGFRSSRKHLNLTEVLKLLLFVDTIWSMKNGGSGLLSSGEQGGSSFVSFLKGLASSNPAYLPPIMQHYTFERINEYFVKDAMALDKAIHSRHEGLSWPSSNKSSPSSKTISLAKKWQEKAPKPFSKTSQTVIIVDWTSLDSALTSMKQMREEISFLLSEYRTLAMMNAASVDDGKSPEVEVVLLLESPGGSVAEYGLAGSLLMQLRDTPGVTLTICVDKVAASGGYMLCCTASPGQLLAAPFAMVGSIGVIGQLINIQDLLTGWGIHPLVFRGGKDKAPVGLIGDITDEGKQRTQEMIDKTHVAFKNHVLAARPVLKEHMSEVGNGDVWLGVDGLRLGLIDAVKTSEEYIGEKLREGVRVLKMIRKPNRGAFGSIYGSSAMEMKIKSMASNFGKSIQSKAESFGVGRWGLTTPTPSVVSAKQTTR